MKKISLFVVLCLFFGLLKAQSVSLGCVTGGSDCFTVCPGTTVTYLATPTFPTGTTANDYDVTYSYSLSPIAAGTLPSPNGANCTVTWNTYSSAAMLTTKATFLKHSDYSVTYPTDTKTVMVKYLAPITQMSFNGTPITNNSTISVACGVQTLNLSVNTTATNPSSSVNYQWNYYNGSTHSVLGSSTNSITFPTDVGTNDASITVTATRSDDATAGGCIAQQFTVNITRPRVTVPTIDGYSAAPLCGGNSAFVVGHADRNDRWIWTATGGVNLASTNQQYLYYTASSDGTLTLTVDNACVAPQSITKPVFGGVRQNIASSDVYLNGAPAQSFNYINGNTYITVRSRGDACEGFKWDVLNGSGYINPISGGCGYSYADPNQGGAVVPFSDGTNCYMSTSNFMRLGVTSSNACGVGAGYTLYLQNASGPYYRMASPNPATSKVAVTLSKNNAPGLLRKINLVSDAKSAEINTFDGESAEGKDHIGKEKDVEFEVSNLPRGKYHVILIFQGNKTFTEQIVLN
jgi:hypothetical protein